MEKLDFLSFSIKRFHFHESKKLSTFCAKPTIFSFIAYQFEMAPKLSMVETRVTSYKRLNFRFSILKWNLVTCNSTTSENFVAKTHWDTFYIETIRGGGSGCAGCAIAHPVFSQMTIFISFLEKKKVWKSDKNWQIYR